jgi:Glycogen recognition site of AMP-activated protein kinase
MSPIDPRLQEALDGERDPGELPVDLREAYDRLIAAAHLVSATPQLSVAARVMAEIRQTGPVYHPDGSVRRAVRWLGRPRAVTVRLRPVWTLALAAGLTAILLMPSGPTASPRPGVAEGVANFVGHFPGARSVEVVGSFNDWSRGTLHLNDDDGDGVWHGAAVLPAGQHEYMFVVDGERWVPDPLAGRYVDDGFGAGQQNSLLIVRPAQGAGEP